MNEELNKLIHAYKISGETIKLVQDTRVVLLVGVSGAGKDTIKNRLLATRKYHHIVSHTTRQPRLNGDVLEEDGVEYHFITQQKAAEMLRNGEFVEAKMYSGNVYGTSAAEIHRANQEGKIALTDIEVQGVAEYKDISQSVIAEFILPPDFNEWQRRLKARYGSQAADPSDIEKRMQTAISELEEALSKPYYHFIVNDNLDESVDAADKIAMSDGSFDRIDRSFKQWAEKLLEDLSKQV